MSSRPSKTTKTTAATSSEESTTPTTTTHEMTAPARKLYDDDEIPVLGIKARATLHIIDLVCLMSFYYAITGMYPIWTCLVCAGSGWGLTVVLSYKWPWERYF
ncbi:Aste57867_13153 [Aphanomyces stellatus]|uniref:Aste57867_13153 protein n=1 Tax=Aphanomyces stellatus TaxID=120398 RepID=A0A485KY30_9STRA|nr:hypothetical protein As57867_013104 [Aphanomyces stellatus]VFT89994.1 Aste57867_13153 [Aphanomyces stellatus]